MRSIIGILFLINLVTSITEQKWRESDDGSIFYIESVKKYNWFEAWHDCARRNMSLIAIDTFAKHQQIDALLRRLYTKCPSFWIAAHDNAVANLFTWASTGEPFTFTNLGANQPADTAKGEHCLLLWDDFQWHDYVCSGKLGYICEEHPLLKKQRQQQSLSKAKDLSDLKNILFYFKNGN